MRKSLANRFTAVLVAVLLMFGGFAGVWPPGVFDGALRAKAAGTGTWTLNILVEPPAAGTVSRNTSQIVNPDSTKKSFSEITLTENDTDSYEFKGWEFSSENSSVKLLNWHSSTAANDNNTSKTIRPKIEYSGVNENITVTVTAKFEEIKTSYPVYFIDAITNEQLGVTTYDSTTKTIADDFTATGKPGYAIQFQVVKEAISAKTGNSTNSLVIDRTANENSFKLTKAKLAERINSSTNAPSLDEGVYKVYVYYRPINNGSGLITINYNDDNTYDYNTNLVDNDMGTAKHSGSVRKMSKLDGTFWNDTALVDGGLFNTIVTTNPGYNFVGWYVIKNGESLENKKLWTTETAFQRAYINSTIFNHIKSIYGDDLSAISNLNFYPMFVQNLEVTYNRQVDSVTTPLDTETVAPMKDGDSVATGCTVPAATDDYILKGWKVGDTETLLPADTNFIPTNNQIIDNATGGKVTFTAVYEQVADSEKINITFETADESVATISTNSGTIYKTGSSTVSCTATQVSSSFKGWYFKKDDDTLIAVPSPYISADHYTLTPTKELVAQMLGYDDVDAMLAENTDKIDVTFVADVAKPITITYTAVSYTDANVKGSAINALLKGSDSGVYSGTADAKGYYSSISETLSYDSSLNSYKAYGANYERAVYRLAQSNSTYAFYGWYDEAGNPISHKYKLEPTDTLAIDGATYTAKYCDKKGARFVFEIEGEGSLSVDKNIITTFPSKLTVTPADGWSIYKWSYTLGGEDKYVEKEVTTASLSSADALKLFNQDSWTNGANVIKVYLKQVNPKVTFKSNNQAMGTVDKEGDPAIEVTESTDAQSVTATVSPIAAQDKFLGWYVGDTKISSDLTLSRTYKQVFEDAKIGGENLVYVAKFENNKITFAADNHMAGWITASVDGEPQTQIKETAKDGTTELSYFVNEVSYPGNALNAVVTAVPNSETVNGVTYNMKFDHWEVKEGDAANIEFDSTSAVLNSTNCKATGNVTLKPVFVLDDTTKTITENGDTTIETGTLVISYSVQYLNTDDRGFPITLRPYGSESGSTATHPGGSQVTTTDDLQTVNEYVTYTKTTNEFGKVSYTFTNYNGVIADDSRNGDAGKNYQVACWIDDYGNSYGSIIIKEVKHFTPDDSLLIRYLEDGNNIARFYASARSDQNIYILPVEPVIGGSIHTSGNTDYDYIFMINSTYEGHYVENSKYPSEDSSIVIDNSPYNDDNTYGPIYGYDPKNKSHRLNFNELNTTFTANAANDYEFYAWDYNGTIIRAKDIIGDTVEPNKTYTSGYLTVTTDSNGKVNSAVFDIKYAARRYKDEDDNDINYHPHFVNLLRAVFVPALPRAIISYKVADDNNVNVGAERAQVDPSMGAVGLNTNPTKVTWSSTATPLEEGWIFYYWRRYTKTYDSSLSDSAIAYEKVKEIENDSQIDTAGKTVVSSDRNHYPTMDEMKSDYQNAIDLITAEVESDSTIVDKPAAIIERTENLELFYYYEAVFGNKFQIPVKYDAKVLENNNMRSITSADTSSIAEFSNLKGTSNDNLHNDDVAAIYATDRAMDDKAPDGIKVDTINSVKKYKVLYWLNDKGEIVETGDSYIPTTGDLMSSALYQQYLGDTPEKTFITTNIYINKSKVDDVKSETEYNALSSEEKAKYNLVPIRSLQSGDYVTFTAVIAPVVDVEISKNVDGNFGSKDKYFKFTVKVSDTGGIDDEYFSDLRFIVDKDNITTEISDINEATTYGTDEIVNANSLNGRNYVTGQDLIDGKVIFYLQHGQSVKLTIPEGVNIKVTESSEDYDPKHTTNSGSETDGDNVEVENLNEDTDLGFTNRRNGIVPTGITTHNTEFILASIVLLGAIYCLSRKRKDDEE